MRCFHLLNQLSRFHEVHAIIFQREEALRNQNNGYSVPSSVRVYSPFDSPTQTSLFNKLPRSIGPGLHFRWLRRSPRGPAESTLLACHHLVKKILIQNKIDAAIFEHISSMHAAPLVKRLSPKTKRILDAHNVDYVLIKQELNSSLPNIMPQRSAFRAYWNTHWIEHHLGKFVHSFFACSDEDRRLLESSSGIRGFTVPNGVDTAFFNFDDRDDKSKSPYLIFSGSMQTVANQNAVDYLLSAIWPMLQDFRSDLQLLLVGSGMPSALAERAKERKNVLVVGEVPDVRPYFRNASVALVPLRIGSGTRLKILEAMSQGNPVVSTTLGAHGLKTVHSETIFLADKPETFVSHTLRLLSDESLFKNLQRAGRHFVEQNFDWQVVGQIARQSIDTLFAKS